MILPERWVGINHVHIWLRVQQCITSSALKQYSCYVPQHLLQ